MQLSNNLDLRTFHNAILEYRSVPQPVLESNIHAFTKNNKKHLTDRYPNS
ncbi:hypothetical protein L0668_04020 [Paraglaciecola aquimarina]|uniref:Uncharacterized protein n=1 Tax=Paraglaciecola algarum TaxID=3050085 RepID=A0ABS9D6F3_9ALTE|nr:hypothetical protein [Paraglaciecola sp. G1-23]MCF2947261.1 hypothetical protein [Paraglaciecola sp. G1-23]